MKDILIKYREIIMYLVFGVLTTIVNIVVYFTCEELFKINYLVSNGLAWFLSVLFAYITNRKYVFVSNNNKFIKEMLSFFSSRLATGILDMVMMWLFIYIINLDDIFAKVTVNIIVVFLNYILSKIVVFTSNNDKIY